MDLVIVISGLALFMLGLFYLGNSLSIRKFYRLQINDGTPIRELTINNPKSYSVGETKIFKSLSETAQYLGSIYEYRNVDKKDYQNLVNNSEMKAWVLANPKSEEFFGVWTKDGDGAWSVSVFNQDNDTIPGEIKTIMRENAINNKGVASELRG